ncbi:MAG: hypothetical protein ACKOCX_02925 [Planctomycetota bacterium]
MSGSGDATIPVGRRSVATLLLLVLAVTAGSRAADEPPAAADVPTFLRLREIDQPRRAAIEAAAEWTPEVEADVVKILQRLDAPPALAAGWKQAAQPAPAAGEAVAVADELLALRGRATFVAPRKLPADLAERLGRPAYDVVRLIDERGLIVDVLTPAAPRSWPRWSPIDEPATALVLPLATAVKPPLADQPADAAAWPEAPASLLAAAAHVAWFPDTPLARLGMDYGLFDTVADGQKLVRGDTAAFFALLEAVGRTDAAAIRAAAAPTDVLVLIDPGRKWLPEHRGDPVVIEGAALRATRVPIDDAFRREQVGSDHYWELYVFTETPLLEVDGRMQNSFPIVCCVRDLPPGMPTGDRINEPVRVPGFAFKRYAYTFEAPREEDGRQVADTERRQTMLVIGPRAAWTPPTPGAGMRGFTIVAGVVAALALAAVFGLGILYGNWSLNRSIKRARQELPDRIDVPRDTDR